MRGFTEKWLCACERDEAAVIKAENEVPIPFKLARTALPVQLVASLSLRRVVQLGSKPVWHNFSSAGNMSRAHPDENSRPQQFGSADVCRIARVSPRQLQWWDEQKILSPVQQGHRRVYLPEDVIGIIVIAGLRRKGFTLERIRPLLP